MKKTLILFECRVLGDGDLISMAGQPDGRPFLNHGKAYYIDGEPLTVKDFQRSLSVREHSPDGFNHGYSGSGPAQLSLAICLKLWGRVGQKMYQDFKVKFVARVAEQHQAFCQNIDVTEFNQIAERKGQTVDLPAGNWKVRHDWIDQHIQSNELVIDTYLVFADGTDKEFTYIEDTSGWDPEDINPEFEKKQEVLKFELEKAEKVVFLFV